MWFRNHATGSLVDQSRPTGLEITRSPFRAASRSALSHLRHAGSLALRPFVRPRATHCPQGRGDDQALDRAPPYRSHMPVHTAAPPRVQQLCIRVQATHRPGAVPMPKRQPSSQASSIGLIGHRFKHLQAKLPNSPAISKAVLVESFWTLEQGTAGQKWAVSPAFSDGDEGRQITRESPATRGRS